jgi:trk system potassium uptake protein
MKTIRNQILFRALAILSIGILFIFIATMLLTFTEDAGLMPILFEVVSAFGTVGLLMSFTPHLSSLGKIIIMFIMFLGKMGPLTLVYSISKPEKTKVRYPDGEMFTG